MTNWPSWLLAYRELSSMTLEMISSGYSKRREAYFTIRDALRAKIKPTKLIISLLLLPSSLPADIPKS